ncbi:MAG: hypothetical protein MZV64_41100 [Ignavibacteriales bacterium]|nr:hypothetical protein [Ignavibacteriales bacterium]
MNNFTVGKIHVTLDRKKDEPILYWIATMYIGLIVMVIGGMFVHNVLDFCKKARIKKIETARLHIESEEHGHSLYLRMTLGERIQHATMAISFMILVITGFMLRYPDSWWVRHIRDLSERCFYLQKLDSSNCCCSDGGSQLVSYLLYQLYNKRKTNYVKDLLPRYRRYTVMQLVWQNLTSGFQKRNQCWIDSAMLRKLNTGH